MRAYNNSLRSVVVTLCILIGIWTLVWGINMFQEMNVDNDHGQPKLGTFALIVGILYVSTTGITVFGIVAASLQREKLVKTFAYASVAAAICVDGAGFLRVIVHFIHKNDLITECTNVVTGTGITFRFGIWGPRVLGNLNPTQAAQFCKDGWNHDSASEIISLIVELVLSVFFVFVAFGYVKQVHQSKKDRKHAMATAGDFEDPVPAPGSSYPAHYNPPYLGYSAGYDTPPSGYAAPGGGYAPAYDAPMYAPPPGAPPVGYHGGSRGGVDGDAGKKDDDPFADFESVKKHGSKESLV